MPNPSPDGSSLGSHGDITFTLRGADCIDALEPLWLQLFDDHQAVGNAGIREIDRADSWPRRRRLYGDLFADPDTLVILAERGTTPVGYALCHIRTGADDTWDTGDLIGEIETLVLMPDARGNGVGNALMDAAEAELGRRGAADILTAVLEGNDRAREFYARRGMTPTVTYLMRIRPAVTREAR
ncbi:MAG: GNAT family N-acetyltransferase [Actinomycetia bacterium]|nr:GNAT family N-acetyltransferase [Actinomycetes bacterium]